MSVRESTQVYIYTFSILVLFYNPLHVHELFIIQCTNQFEAG